MDELNQPETSSSKKKWGIGLGIVAFIVILVVVGLLYYYGFFTTVATEGQVVESPCSTTEENETGSSSTRNESENKCILVSYTIKDEYKDKGQAGGTISQQHTLAVDDAAKYKKGDTIQIYYSTSEPTKIALTRIDAK